jgi:hypothetical protein
LGRIANIEYGDVTTGLEIWTIDLGTGTMIVKIPRELLRLEVLHGDILAEMCVFCKKELSRSYWVFFVIPRYEESVSFFGDRIEADPSFVRITKADLYKNTEIEEFESSIKTKKALIPQ